MNFSPLGYFSDNNRWFDNAFVTLQRPPPEIFTFPKNLEVFSKTRTCACGKCFFAEMAAKNPAAPPPKMTISNVYLLVFGKNQEQLGEKKLFERINLIFGFIILELIEFNFSF